MTKKQRLIEDLEFFFNETLKESLPSNTRFFMLPSDIRLGSNKASVCLKNLSTGEIVYKLTGSMKLSEIESYMKIFHRVERFQDIHKNFLR